MMNRNLLLAVAFPGLIASVMVVGFVVAQPPSSMNQLVVPPPRLAEPPYEAAPLYKAEPVQRISAQA
jgi:hypothetical protein